MVHVSSWKHGATHTASLARDCVSGYQPVDMNTARHDEDRDCIPEVGAMRKKHLQGLIAMMLKNEKRFLTPPPSPMQRSSSHNAELLEISY